MDDKTPLPTSPPPAARTAEALRQLHDRARTAVAAQRERMKQLELQLTEQLDSIADTIAEQIAEQDEQTDQARSSVLDVEQFRAELDLARAEWHEERTRSEAEQAERAEKLDARLAELDTRQQALDERSTDLNQQERALREQQESLDMQASQCAAQQARLSEAEEALALAKQQKESELQARLATVEQQLATERAAWEQERSSVDEQRRLLAKERDELATALDAARTELTAARELASAAGELGELQQERDELQQKFDLAIDDLQLLRSRVAELEQELATRPAGNETDSVELVHLRAERDALAERIAELERKPAAIEGGDDAQERADLQRRFELAVEDVRDLKKKNAELEARLADVSANAPAAIASGGGSNWEAMKKQMLANLADEPNDGDEDRQAERATIGSTIRITDEALERKDREIAELKARIADSQPAVPDEDETVRQLVDADEVIAEHRARIAQMEQEMHDKLRAAELEVSVERAKLAREKVQLADLRAELEAHRPVEAAPTGAGPQHPKRRWLSKLGLTGEEGE